MRGSKSFILNAANTKRRFEIVEILERENRVLTIKEINQLLIEREYKSSLRRTYCDLLKIAGAVPHVSMHNGRRTHWIYEDLSHLNAEDA